MNPYQLTAEQRDQEASRAALNPLEVKAYVILTILTSGGGRFLAPHDAYNYQSNRDTHASSWREVVAYYDHFILTVLSIRGRLHKDGVNQYIRKHLLIVGIAGAKL